MQGEAISADEVAREIAPCFVERDGRRTDAIVLACTHYPLLLDFFTRLAPWPVHWIDPAAAIARRADHVISDRFPKIREAAADFSFPFHQRRRADAINLAEVAAGPALRGALKNKSSNATGFDALLRRRVIAACAAAIPARDLRRVDLAFEIGQPLENRARGAVRGDAIFDQRRVNFMRLAAGERFFPATKVRSQLWTVISTLLMRQRHRVGLDDNRLALLENNAPPGRRDILRARLFRSRSPRGDCSPTSAASDSAALPPVEAARAGPAANSKATRRRSGSSS